MDSHLSSKFKLPYPSLVNPAIAASMAFDFPAIAAAVPGTLLCTILADADNPTYVEFQSYTRTTIASGGTPAVGLTTAIAGDAIELLAISLTDEATVTTLRRFVADTPIYYGETSAPTSGAASVVITIKAGDEIVRNP